MNKISTVRRIGIADAKAHLSEVLRDAKDEPVIIHNRGRDIAVVVGIETYERLREAERHEPTPMQRFLGDIAELKDRCGGGAELEYERFDYTSRNPFGRLGKKRG